MDDRYDIAVVGAGPCGLSVGTAAARAGMTCILFDRGCIANSLLDYPLYMTFFSSADRLEIGSVPFTIAELKPTRREALHYYRRVVRHFDLDVRQYEAVEAVEGTKGDFRLATRLRTGEERAYRARNVVVATGGFDEPNLLEVPGEELDKVSHHYREGHPFYDQDCLVVGGGNSAVETALDLFRSGARVTLVHFLDDLDPGVKPWVLPDIRNRLKKGEIAVHWRTRVEEIRPGSVLLRHDDTGASATLENDWVFAMTGYSPDPSLLRSIGVEVDEESRVPAHDPETMETNVPGVYIAGVLAAGRDANRIFIENGRDHGPRIVEALARRRETAGAT